MLAGRHGQVNAERAGQKQDEGAYKKWSCGFLEDQADEDKQRGNAQQSDRGMYDDGVDAPPVIEARRNRLL